MSSENLFERLQAKYPENFSRCFDFSIDDGWNDIVERLTDQVIALDPEIKIEQVKSKFGGLRYYVESATEDIYFLIETAEDASTRTCEVCGAEGRARGGGWVVTLCDEHAKGVS